jgi:hypothetical protein
MAVEMQSVIEMMMETSRRIDKATRVLHTLAKDKAEAQHNYVIKKAQETLILKQEGMSVTLIQDIVKGKCADELLERDRTEEVFKASVESLRAMQSQLSALQSISKYQSEV